MKKALLALALVSISASVFAKYTVGNDEVGVKNISNKTIEVKVERSIKGKHAEGEVYDLAAGKMMNFDYTEGGKTIDKIKGKKTTLKAKNIQPGKLYEIK